MTMNRSLAFAELSRLVHLAKSDTAREAIQVALDDMVRLHELLKLWRSVERTESHFAKQVNACFEGMEEK